MYYYYKESGEIATAPSAMSIPEEIEVFAKLSDAVRFVQKLGCVGTSQHIIKEGEKGEFHRLCLEVLKRNVREIGEVFSLVLRGVRPSSYPDAEHKILFGSTDRKVAEFYGEIREYRNIKGLKVFSLMRSVNYEENGDESEMDEEIIFFPEEI